jgi:energy-coupling factor transport system ATP-binding protein
LIEFSHVTHVYPNSPGSQPALSDVSLQLHAGEHLAVLGGNGSGKSTLVRLVNGLLLPSDGAVTVDGIDTRDPRRTREVRERVGIVFQNPDDQIVATSVEDDVAFGPENLSLPRAELRVRVDEALCAVGLTGLESREPHLLSGGQKQRLAMAGALAMRPSYLVLDEPTSMLDPAGRTDVLGIIARMAGGATGILHVTHDIADVLSADRAIVLDRGAVAWEGPIGGLLGEEALLERCGLELPAISQLAKQLRDAGLPVAREASTPAQLVEALWA